MQLVLASGNPGKLAEFRALFRPVGIDLIAQGDLGVGDADEPHATFVENALTKARHAAEQTQLPALADDSGLCVDALGGAPGVLSARYALLAGGQKSDADNNRVLLERMRGIDDRSARFVSVLVAVRRADDPEPLIAFGRWQGELLDAPRGDGGFGYDPLLFIPALGCSVAELGSEQKNLHSHRGIATRAMLALLREVWRLG